MRHGWQARHGYLPMHWNGGLVEARHHHVNRVFSAQDTNATDFLMKLWYDSIAKCILHNFSRQILAQAVKNVHDHILILWQIKG